MAPAFCRPVARRAAHLASLHRHHRAVAIAPAASGAAAPSLCAVQQPIGPHSCGPPGIAAAQQPSPALPHGADWLGYGIVAAAAAAATAATGGLLPVAACEKAAEDDEEDPPDIRMSSTAQWRLLTDLGREMYAQRRMDEAERLLRRALKHAKKGFGADDEHVAAACNNLAELYRLQGRFADAEVLYLEGLRIMEAFLGPQMAAEHGSIGQACHHLGGLYLQMGRYRDAQRYFSRALTTYAEGIGAGHPHYARSLHQLAEAHRMLGERDEASRLLAQALEVLEDCGAGGTPSAVRLRARLARLLTESGDLGGAEPLQRTLLAWVDEKQGSRHPNAATARETLAMTLARGEVGGGVGEARELLMEALELRKSVRGGERAPATGAAMRMLAEIELLAAQRAPPSSDDGGGGGGGGGGDGGRAEDLAMASELASRACAVGTTAWRRSSRAASDGAGDAGDAAGGKAPRPPPYVQHAVELSRVLRVQAGLSLAGAPWPAQEPGPEGAEGGVAGSGGEGGPGAVALYREAQGVLDEALGLLPRGRHLGSEHELRAEKAEALEGLAGAVRAGGGWRARWAARGHERAAAKIRAQAKGAPPRPSGSGPGIWLD